MNRLLVVFCATLLLLGERTRTVAASRGSGTVQILGKRYLRLSDWARNDGLEFRWVKQDETIIASNNKFTIHLRVNSNESDLNGVNVRLLFAVALREGIPYLAELDAFNTFQPLLSPPKNRPAQSIKKICLDPGHGGSDPGYLVNGKEEKKYTLLLAQELRDQLSKAGFKVFLTRTSDKRPELGERADFARRKAADVFISLHFNAFTEKTVRGTEVYCLTPAGAPSTNARGEGAGAGRFTGNANDQKNMFLAFQMQKSLTKSLGVEDRGVHRARFQVLREAEMPAVLIEGGFLSHPTEGKKILDAAYRRQMAKAIADGLLAYKKQVDQTGDKTGSRKH